MNRVIAVGACLLLLCACDGDSGGDAGPADTDAGPGVSDAGPGTDAGPIDAGPPTPDAGSDAGPPSCGGVECAPDQACLRDVCLDTCGADLSGWDAALAAGLTPVHVFCGSALSTSVSGTDTTVYALRTNAVGDGSELVLEAWQADPTTPVAPSVVAMATVSHTTENPLYPGGYAFAAAGGHVFGHTLMDGSGQVLVVGSGGARAVAAPGNFAAVALTDDVLLVNGLGLGVESGQALYALDTADSDAARAVVTSIGDYSGGVAVTDDYALIGGTDAGFVGHLYATSRAALDAAVAGGAAIDAPTEVMRMGTGPVASSFALVGGQIVFTRYDDSFAREALEAHPVIRWDDATGLTLGAVFDLTTGPTFSAVYAAAEDRMLLRFGEGVLLVE